MGITATVPPGGVRRPDPSPCHDRSAPANPRLEDRLRSSDPKRRLLRTTRRRRRGRVPRAGVDPVPARVVRWPSTGYLQRTRFVYTGRTMTTAPTDIDLAELIADTEGEIVRLVRDRDPSTHGLYEMVRYHLALDGSGA